MNCRNSPSDVSTLFHPDDDFSRIVKVFTGVGDEDVGHYMVTPLWVYKYCTRELCLRKVKSVPFCNKCLSIKYTLDGVSAAEDGGLSVFRSGALVCLTPSFLPHLHSPKASLKKTIGTSWCKWGRDNITLDGN
jgi:hypothetical protein